MIMLFSTDASQVIVTRPDQHLDRSDIDSIARNMFGQISFPELYRIAFYYEISDDTMATLENQYAASPVMLLSNILLYWMDHQDQQATRRDFAVILDNLGILPSSVM